MAEAVDDIAFGTANGPIKYWNYNLYAATSGGSPSLIYTFAQYVTPFNTHTTTFTGLAQAQANGLDVNGQAVSGGAAGLFSAGYTPLATFNGAGRYGGRPGPLDPAGMMTLSRYGPDALGVTTPAATSLEVSGPTINANASRSGGFVVRPDGEWSGTVTLSAIPGGVTFMEQTLTWNGEAGAKASTIDPTATNTIYQITMDPDTLPAPSTWTYQAGTPATGTFSFTGPASGLVGGASTAFTGDPNTGGTRGRFFDVTRYSAPAPGSLGNAKKGSLKGPGTWILNLAFYKDVVRTNGLTVEITALLDNALNHPQFFIPSLGTQGFVDVTDYVLGGDAANGTTGVLGADTVGNVEGFSAGRVVRFGARVRF